jgi:uncharacterized HAD superfamily protein
MRIGIDLDEVLAKMVVELNNFYNRRYGTNFSFDDYAEYDLEVTWGGSRDRAVRIVREFYSSSFFKDIQPLDGSQEGIDKMFEENELFVVTARPSLLKRRTEEWIEKYFSGRMKEVIYTGEYSLHSSEMSKEKICLGKGIEIILEDNLETARKCSLEGIRSVLFDRPWNQNGFDRSVVRVRSWKEALEAVANGTGIR